MPSSREGSLPTLEESLILPEPVFVHVNSSLLPFTTGSEVRPSDALEASSTLILYVKLPVVSPR